MAESKFVTIKVPRGMYEVLKYMQKPDETLADVINSVIDQEKQVNRINDARKRKDQEPAR